MTSVSVLFGVLGVLYAVWYADIQSAIATEAPIHLADRAPAIETVRHALWHRAVPLASASTAVTIIFLPVVIPPAVQLIRHISSNGLGALQPYDPIMTTIAAVTLALAGLTIHTLGLTTQLATKLHALKRP